MGRYILKRILIMIPLLLCICLLIFTIMYFTPGDPIATMYGDNLTAEDIARYKAEWGLDQPFFTRFFTYVKGLFHGDLGRSYVTKQSVTSEIIARFPTTFKLALYSEILALIIGITCGIIAATRQYSFFDHLATGVSLFGVSMPGFWQGLMLILIFAVNLKLLPASGFKTWKHWILPVLSIGPSCSANIMRMTRSSMLEVLRSDYIRTARAKGCRESVVICVHALKNALIPIITAAGMSFAGLLGGAVMCETIFVIPGIGKLMVDGVAARNYPLVQGSVLFVAAVSSFVNLAVDLLYTIVDPRIKTQFIASNGRAKKAKEANDNE